MSKLLNISMLNEIDLDKELESEPLSNKLETLTDFCIKYDLKYFIYEKQNVVGISVFDYVIFISIEQLDHIPSHSTKIFLKRKIFRIVWEQNKFIIYKPKIYPDTMKFKVFNKLNYFYV